MNETYLRTWHRRMGIVLAFFIFLQASSGLMLNLENLFEITAITRWSKVLHLGGGDVGTVYRTLLGLGLLGMAASGSLIYYKIWQRTTKNNG